MIVHTYPAKETSISEILDFVREIYKKAKYNKREILEYELLCEEVILQVIDVASPEAEIQVSFDKKLGGNKLVFACEGEAINLEKVAAEDISLKIITDYSERLSQTRRHGTNYITISTNTTSNIMTKQFFASTVLAVLTCVILRLFLDLDQINWVITQISEPLTMVFIKLLQCFAVPVAFLSLVTYLINYHDSVEYDENLKKVSLRFVFSSVTAIIIAYLIWKIAQPLLDQLVQNMGGSSIIASGSEEVSANNAFFGNSLADFISQIVPGNLVEIFTLTNPIPMLVLALILGLGINSYSSRANNRLRTGLNDLTDLISHLITMVFALLPVFLYFSIIYAVLYQMVIQEITLLLIGSIAIIVIILVGFILLYGFYFVELLTAGIYPGAFIKKYKDMLRENFKIASNIDALPYNQRAFRRKLGRKGNAPLVRATLNLGTLMNMDGNCLVITLGILIFNQLFGQPISLVVMIELFIIIILLGVGSPNQPGSYTLATVVLMSFLGIDSSYAGFIIIVEALFCKLYSATNAIGDIVTVVMYADDDLKKKKGQSKAQEEK